MWSKGHKTVLLAWSIRTGFAAPMPDFRFPSGFTVPGDMWRPNKRSLIFLYLRIGDGKFREAIAERVARETECARRLTLISIGAAEGFADGFVFPLFERHAGRQDVRRVCNGAMGRIVQINVGGIEQAS